VTLFSIDVRTDSGASVAGGKGPLWLGGGGRWSQGENLLPREACIAVIPLVVSTSPISDSFPGPPIVTREEVLAKCAFFSRSQLWPREVDFDPVGWLSNFRNSEETFADQLLNGVMFFSRSMTEEMFRSAFQELSRSVSSQDTSFLNLLADWRSFVDSCLITYVTGESEHPADSGHIFARLARNYLGIPEEQIRTPRETVQELHDNGPRPVIFVDDFVGSGNQFVTTWQREYPLVNGTRGSFCSTMGATPFPAKYVTVLATREGAGLIHGTCPGVQITAAHLLDVRHSVLHPNSFFWPREMLSSAVPFLQEASERAGIPFSDGADTDDWQGFHRLGLALGFEHGTPDATIGLLRWTKNQWRPLMVKR
jgi:hypothetical protein